MACEGKVLHCRLWEIRLNFPGICHACGQRPWEQRPRLGGEKLSPNFHCDHSLVRACRNGRNGRRYAVSLTSWPLGRVSRQKERPWPDCEQEQAMVSNGEHHRKRRTGSRRIEWVSVSVVYWFSGLVVECCYRNITQVVLVTSSVDWCAELSRFTCFSRGLLLHCSCLPLPIRVPACVTRAKKFLSQRWSLGKELPYT